MKHTKIQSSQDPLSNHNVGITCSECGKRFTQEKYLKIHMNVHKPKDQQIIQLLLLIE